MLTPASSKLPFRQYLLILHSSSAARLQTQLGFSQDACPNLISLSADYPEVLQGWAGTAEFNIAAHP